MSARLCGRRPKRLSFCAESFLFTISGTCRLADSSYRMRGDPLNEEVLDWVEPDFSCLASVQSYYLSIFKLNSIFPPLFMLDRFNLSLSVHATSFVQSHICKCLTPCAVCSLCWGDDDENAEVKPFPSSYDSLHFTRTLVSYKRHGWQNT